MALSTVMLIIRRKNRTDWRALGVLIVLLAGVFTPAIGLLLSAQDTCGMACCEESGVCYCFPDRSERISAEAQTGANSTGINVPTIGSSCPAHCAQIPASFQKHSIVKARPPRIALVIRTIRQLPLQTPRFARDALEAEAHAPRAPPTVS